MTTLQRISARAVALTNIALTGTQTIDTVALIAGDEVLLQNQTSPAENGLWVVASGAWSRATDFDTAGEMLAGTQFHIREGTADNAGSTFEFRTTGTITVGTTALTFARTGWGAGAIDDGAGTDRAGNTLGLIERPGVAGRMDVGPLSVNWTDRGVVSSLALGEGQEAYIEGLVPSWGWTGGNGVTFSSGAAYLPEVGEVVDDLVDRGVPTSAFSLSAGWAYVYLTRTIITSPAGTEFTAEISNTAPAAPYFGTSRLHPTNSRRFALSIRMINATQLYKFTWEPYSDHYGLVRYLEDAAASPFLVLNAGAATTETTVSCSGVVPPTSRMAKLRVSANASAAVALGNSEDNLTLSSTSYLQQVRLSTATEIDMPLDSSQAFTYRNLAASGGTDISVLGYCERR